FGQATHDSRQDFRRQANTGEYSENRLNNTTLIVDYNMGQGTLRSISGWVGYEFDELCDCDFTPGQIFSTAFIEDYSQFSQEFRITSPDGDTGEWIAGIYYQTTEIEFNDEIRVPSDSMLGLVSPSLTPMLGTIAARDFDQEGDAFAIFGQYDWNIGTDLILTLGGRFTREKKTASRRVDTLDLETGTITINPIAPFVFEQAFGIVNEQASGHNLDGRRNETAFTPSLGFKYWFYPDMMIYGNWRRGFKAGGFDSRANSPRSFGFNEEDADNFEIGIKSTVLEGRGEFNLAWFYTDYDNLQISQFDGTSGFNVGNARNSVVTGIDVNGRLLLDNNLSLNFAMAYLDYE
ncbi:MAG: TonB-dependent receptor, partial [Pseudohongiellaceae bacterium]